MNKLIDHMVESVQKSDMLNNDTELSSVDTAGMEQVAAGQSHTPKPKALRRAVNKDAMMGQTLADWKKRKR